MAKDVLVNPRKRRLYHDMVWTKLHNESFQHLPLEDAPAEASTSSSSSSNGLAGRLGAVEQVSTVAAEAQAQSGSGGGVVGGIAAASAAPPASGRTSQISQGLHERLQDELTRLQRLLRMVEDTSSSLDLRIATCERIRLHGDESFPIGQLLSDYCDQVSAHLRREKDKELARESIRAVLLSANRSQLYGTLEQARKAELKFEELEQLETAISNLELEYMREEYMREYTRLALLDLKSALEERPEPTVKRLQVAIDRCRKATMASCVVEGNPTRLTKLPD